jgi:Cu-Zn family superoxide dismutase
MKRITLLLASLATVLLAATLYLGTGGGARADDDEAEAKAVLRNAAGTRVGKVEISEEDGGVVEVAVKVDAPLASLAAGFHGFHIHAVGNCTADPAQPETTWFTSAGGHYKDADPVHAHHGTHNGDLPLLLVNDDGGVDGAGEAQFVTDRFSVADVVGRAFIVHKLADNYRNIPLGTGATQYTANSDNVSDPATATGATAATGNAGPRLACGVIKG